LRTADTLAESRRGGADPSAVAVAYERAAQAASSSTSSPPTLLIRALLGLGEARQRQAEAAVEAARRQAGLTLEAERSAVEAALALLSSAAAACDEALSRASTAVDDTDAMREDAAANGARALCTAAGFMLGSSSGGGEGAAATAAALPLLDRAVALYEGLLPSEAATGAQDDDPIPPVETLTDLADALMQRAEARASSAAADVESDVSRALDCYGRACGACDSSQGDDLPGLLHNWGVGLFTAARLAAGQQQASLHFLGEAAGKLRASAAFARGDPQPHNALGDVLVALAERAAAASGAEEAAAVAAAAAAGLASSASDGASLVGRAAAATRADLSSASASSPAGLARALLRAAVAEGYGGALTLSRRDADGLVGCGEVAVLMGKAEAAAASGGGNAATAHFAEAARLYAQALRDAPPASLGSVEERAAVAWNAACAAALSGDARGAAATLRSSLGLSAAAGFSPADVLAEEDLRAVWSQPGWEEAVFGAGG
jgi:hypothetical protein